MLQQKVLYGTMFLIFFVFNYISIFISQYSIIFILNFVFIINYVEKIQLFLNNEYWTILVKGN